MADGIKIEDLPTAEERKRARDREARDRYREATGADWSPVVGTDNYEYPAWIYQDYYGGSRHMSKAARQDRERKFRETHAKWPEWK